jgi:hypothetical protein
MLTLLDYDLDLDLHAIWHESSSIPTPPPCLATDPNDLWQGLLGKDDHAEYETQGSSLIECLFLHQSRQLIQLQVDRSRSSDQLYSG